MCVFFKGVLKMVRFGPVIVFFFFFLRWVLVWVLLNLGYFVTTILGGFLVLGLF